MQVKLDKISVFWIKSFTLKDNHLALSIFISLLVIITFLSISGPDPHIQSAVVTTDTVDASSFFNYLQEGHVLLNNSKFEEAMASFDNALKLDRRSSDVLNGKGLILNQLGKYEEAITWFDKALEIDPIFADGLNNKGITLSNLGKYEEAITWFDKALEIEPGFVDAMYNKADALGELGRYEEALVWTDKALSLKPAVQKDSNSNDLFLPND